jgi:hypothetical protein
MGKNGGPVLGPFFKFLLEKRKINLHLIYKFASKKVLCSSSAVPRESHHFLYIHLFVNIYKHPLA